MAASDGGVVVSPKANPGERLRRLLAIIPWLAARGTATFEEIAERFGMDVATVEDELLLAACCGLPPYSPDQLIELVIDDEGVTANVPAYFRRPLRLTAADGFAILAAGRALLAVPGSDEAGPLATALAKLERVVGGGEDGTGPVVTGPVVAGRVRWRSSSTHRPGWASCGRRSRRTSGWRSSTTPLRGTR